MSSSSLDSHVTNSVDKSPEPMMILAHSVRSTMELPSQSSANPMSMVTRPTRYLNGWRMNNLVYWEWNVSSGTLRSGLSERMARSREDGQAQQSRIVLSNPSWNNWLSRASCKWVEWWGDYERWGLLDGYAIWYGIPISEERYQLRKGCEWHDYNAMMNGMAFSSIPHMETGIDSGRREQWKG